MNSIKCFIFDLDGTLVFNEDVNFLAYEAAFKQLGIEFTRDDFTPVFQSGGNIDAMYTAQTKRTNTTYDQDILAQVQEIKVKEYAKRMHLIEQNQAIVGLLRALAPHYHTALASTSRKLNGMEVISTFGLADLFDIMLFRDDVTHKKPDPECHQIIAKHFNVTPEECMIFEDSSSGFAAAKAFGGHLCKVLR